MKISSVFHFLTFALVCLVMCSCTGDRTARIAVGDDPAWIPQQDSMRVAQDFVSSKGYPNAECVSADIGGKDCQFLFENSDHTLRLMVHVNRKTKDVRIVERIHLKQGETSFVQTPLTATQAQILSVELANDKADSLYHRRPFHNSRTPQLAEGRWVWTASEGVGRMDVQAKVELAADGSTNKVDVEAFDSALVR